MSRRYWTWYWAGNGYLLRSIDHIQRQHSCVYLRIEWYHPSDNLWRYNRHIGRPATNNKDGKPPNLHLCQPSLIMYPQVTTTTVSVSVSVSVSNQISTVTGPTYTQSGDVITITRGGGGAGGYITVTAPPSIIISYVFPSSSSSSFTCRTYATNYLNGMHGKVKRTDKRSIFDIDSPLVMGDGEMMRPQPGAVPMP